MKKDECEITYEEFQKFALMLFAIKADHWESDNFSGTTKCPFCEAKMGYAFLNGGCQFKSVKCSNLTCRTNAIWKQIETFEEKEKKKHEQENEETTNEVLQSRRGKTHEKRNTGTGNGTAAESTSECRLGEIT